MLGWTRRVCLSWGMGQAEACRRHGLPLHASQVLDREPCLLPTMPAAGACMLPSWAGFQAGRPAQEQSKKRAAKNWRKAKVAVTRKITTDMLGVQRK